MRLLLDTCLSGKAATTLRDSGHDVVWVSNFVAITAVPEPSTLVLAALGPALAAWAARRRVPRQGMMQS